MIRVIVQNLQWTLCSNIGGSVAGRQRSGVAIEWMERTGRGAHSVSLHRYRRHHRRSDVVIDHISLAVRNLEQSATFYERVLAPLSYARLVERPATVGFGKRYPELWLNLRPGMTSVAPGSGAHVALRASSEEAVRAFHAAALANGGLCDGPPGERPAAMTRYFGAFILDPDGNRVEALFIPATGLRP